jgi:hypothetical protein
VATTVNIADGTNGRITGRITAQPRLHQGASSGFGLQHSVPHGPRADEEASSRMNDEGCPNENPSRNNATRYPKEDEEATSVS